MRFTNWFGLPRTKWLQRVLVNKFIYLYGYKKKNYFYSKKVPAESILRHLTLKPSMQLAFYFYFIRYKEFTFFDIQNNNLTRIDVNLFDSCKNIISVSLSGNGLSDDYIQSLSNLKFINFTN